MFWAPHYIALLWPQEKTCAGTFLTPNTEYKLTSWQSCTGLIKWPLCVPVPSVWWAVKRWTLPPRSSAPRWRWRAGRARRSLVPAAGRGQAGWRPAAVTGHAGRCSPSAGLSVRMKPSVWKPTHQHSLLDKFYHEDSDDLNKHHQLNDLFW